MELKNILRKIAGYSLLFAITFSVVLLFRSGGDITGEAIGESFVVTAGIEGFIYGFKEGYFE